MDEAASLRAAIDLMRVPTRVRRLRMQPLPDGMTLLLRVAAADRQAESEAMALTNRPPTIVREAASFFIEQILLSPDADSYRCLGARPSATNAELRRHMVLLLKVLHPDTAPGDRALFARRVTAAWDQLKTGERRAAYDAARKPGTKASTKKKRMRPPASRNLPAARNGGGADRHTALTVHRGISEGLLRRTLRHILAERGRDRVDG